MIPEDYLTSTWQVSEMFFATQRGVLKSLTFGSMRGPHNAEGSFRRTFLQITATGAALPAAAEAALPNLDRVPVSDEQALDACIGQLKNILARMHPKVCDAKLSYTAWKAGGFALVYVGHVPKVEWSGPGEYIILDAGFELHVWIDRYWDNADKQWMYGAACLMDGYKIAPRLIFSDHSLKIVRRLDVVTTKAGEADLDRLKRGE